MKRHLFLHFTPAAAGLTRSSLIICGLAAALTPASILSAATQEPHYKVEGLNFDLWCQQQAKLPPIRCDQRTAIDENAYNAYRDKIDRYEIPFLQTNGQKHEIERSILNSDPVDNPQGALAPLP